MAEWLRATRVQAPYASSLLCTRRAAVAKRLDCPPPAKGERSSISGWATAGFLQVGIVSNDAAGRRVSFGSFPFPPPLHSGAAQFSHRFTLIGSQDLIFKSRNLVCVSYWRISSFGWIRMEEEIQESAVWVLDTGVVVCNLGDDRVCVFPHLAEEAPGVMSDNPRTICPDDRRIAEWDQWELDSDTIVYFLEWHRKRPEVEECCRVHEWKNVDNRIRKLGCKRFQILEPCCGVFSAMCNRVPDSRDGSVDFLWRSKEFAIHGLKWNRLECQGFMSSGVSSVVPAWISGGLGLSVLRNCRISCQDMLSFFAIDYDPGRIGEQVNGVIVGIGYQVCEYDSVEWMSLPRRIIRVELCNGVNVRELTILGDKIESRWKDDNAPEEEQARRASSTGSILSNRHLPLATFRKTPHCVRNLPRNHAETRLQVSETHVPSRLKSRNPPLKLAEDLDTNGFYPDMVWQQRWTESNIISPLFAFSEERKDECMLDGKLWCTLNRLRTGHGRCNSMLHKWRLRDDPSCPCDLGDQTICHLLLECPQPSYPGPTDDIKDLSADAIKWSKSLNI
ncbi:hypothetical protein PR048_014317 [Dryococelus australis]|uniref:Uncharacterized protein n=1 Tax=Dryococelus australis TaxID=614101 RepID=A0ABQ9HDX3_9NEOP|nr:hypothetical protein PR048_014317 [Dryococelus australis]